MYEKFVIREFNAAGYVMWISSDLDRHIADVTIEHLRKVYATSETLPKGITFELYGRDENGGLHELRDGGEINSHDATAQQTDLLDNQGDR